MGHEFVTGPHPRPTANLVTSDEVGRRTRAGLNHSQAAINIPQRPHPEVQGGPAGEDVGFRIVVANTVEQMSKRPLGRIG